ncbi:hypothetical protein Emag_007315 [Eimeria magna]
MQLRWILQANGHAASLPLPALLNTEYPTLCQAGHRGRAAPRASGCHEPDRVAFLTLPKGYRWRPERTGTKLQQQRHQQQLLRHPRWTWIFLPQSLALRPVADLFFACSYVSTAGKASLLRAELCPQQEGDAEAATGSIAAPAAAADEEKTQQKAVSNPVEEVSSNRQICAIISTVRQKGPDRGDDFHSPRKARQFCYLHTEKRRLRFWEVRLFAKSCAFLAASRRAKTSISGNHSDSSSSIDSSSDSGSDTDLECTHGSSCLQAEEKFHWLPHAAPWWSDSVLDTMQHKPSNPCHIDAASRDLWTVGGSFVWFRFHSESAKGHKQLQGEEARGRACLVDTVAEPVEVDVGPLSTKGSWAQTFSKGKGNCSNYSHRNSENHNSSRTTRISIPFKGGTANTRCNGGKTARLQQVGMVVKVNSLLLSGAPSVAANVAAALSAAAFVRLSSSKDSTLIEEEVIDEIAAEVGKKEEVAVLTRSAMGGSLPFAESLKRRLSVLKGLDRAALSKVSGRLTLTQGALALCRLLKSRGVFLAILSGGFAFFAEGLKQKLHVDYTAANQLNFDQEGRLTGEAQDPIVTPEEKRRLLLLLSEKQQQRWQVHLAAAATAAGPAVATASAAVAATQAGGFNAAAIGDGSNDILMLRASETGIAFCAKENVRAKVPIHLQARNLWLAAYFLGIYQSCMSGKQSSSGVRQ